MDDQNPIYLHTINIVVRDMPKALAFYRLLGLSIPESDDLASHVELTMPNGASVGFDTETVTRESNPNWVTPIGQRVSFAFKCNSLTQVNSLYAQLVSAGYTGLKEPWDAFWGQRYSMVQDADGNRVDLFAELAT